MKNWGSYWLYVSDWHFGFFFLYLFNTKISKQNSYTLDKLGFLYFLTSTKFFWNFYLFSNSMPAIHTIHWSRRSFDSCFAHRWRLRNQVRISRQMTSGFFCQSLNEAIFKSSVKINHDLTNCYKPSKRTSLNTFWWITRQ